MPTLSKPIPSATLGANSQVDLAVNGTINWTPFDLALMRLGLVFSLKCRMKGDDDADIPPDRDDELPGAVLAPPRLTFTGVQPVTVNYRFAARVDSSTLNEDKDSIDEIYAVATLSHNFPTSTLERESDNIVGEFGTEATAAAQ